MVIDTEIAVTTIPNPNSVKLRRIKIPITFFNFPADTIYCHPIKPESAHTIYTFRDPRARPPNKLSASIKRILKLIYDRHHH